MNVATAIWKINPAAEYRLTSANANSWEDIIEWRGPGPKPTAQELDNAWQAYLIEQGEEESASIYEQQIKDEAEAEIDNIPGYASWTVTEADTWYQNNIRDPFTTATTAAELKAVLGTVISVQWAIIRLVLAVRNWLWWWKQNQI